MAVSKECNDICSMCTFNMHGYNQGLLNLKRLTDVLKCDIICLQETWLSSDLQYKFDYFKSNYILFHSTCELDKKLSYEILKGRPFGGVSILINKILCKRFRNISLVQVADKFLIVKCDQVLIVNLYLPKCVSDSDFDSLLDILYALKGCISQESYSAIFCCGDFNCNLTVPSRASLLIVNFLTDLNVTVSDNLSDEKIEYSFMAESRNAFSHIDFICVPDNLDSKVSVYVDLCVDNFSDHLPVLTHFETCPFIQFALPDSSEVPFNSAVNNNCRVTFDWAKGNLPLYYESTRSEFYPMFTTLSHYKVADLELVRPDLFAQKGIDCIFNNLCHSLLRCAEKSLPLKKASKHEKYWWDDVSKSTKIESLVWDKRWKQAGKPKSGNLFSQRAAARKRYRTHVRHKRNGFHNNISSRLENTLCSAKHTEFWTIWNKTFKKTRRPNICVNNLKQPKEIADCLAEHFASVCKPNDPLKHENFKTQYFTTASDYVSSNDWQFLNDNFFTVETVDLCLKKLGNNKAPGSNKITANFLKYAHPCVLAIIAILFNILLYKGVVPEDFRIGVISAIPKFKSSKLHATAEEFRGISVNSIFSKLFEHCLLVHLSNIKTSDRQFGFKKGVGCNHAIGKVRKIINYYVNRKSTVNVTIVDLKKAFDKVNIYGLLSLLQSHDVPSKIVKTLENWFSNCSAKVSWNAAFSELVDLSAGVRQGGILSPYLFTIYVDRLLIDLGQMQYGCRINYECLNSFMYADDLILLSSSVTDMQKMLDFCQNFFHCIDMPVNVNKCKVLRIGAESHLHCGDLLFDGQPLPFVNEIVYLGVTILGGRKLKFCWHKAKQKFFIAANAILGKLQSSNSLTVALKLMETQCIPHLTYGIAATGLSKTALTSLTFVYNSIFCKLFKVKEQQNILWCQYFCNFLSFDLLYRYLRFVSIKSLLLTNNISPVSPLDVDDFIDYNNFKAQLNMLVPADLARCSNKRIKNVLLLNMMKT